MTTKRAQARWRSADLAEVQNADERLKGAEQQGNAPYRLPLERMGSFLLFNILFGLFFFTHLADLFRFFLHQQNYPHPGLVPLISLYLIALRRRELLQRAEYGVRSGIGLMLVGAFCYALGLYLKLDFSHNDFLTVTTLGIVISWIGGFVAFFGIPSARIVLFPLFFLIFAVPPPDVLIHHIITTLQHASADMAYWLFKRLPIPVYRQGVYFTLPGLTIEVARECSGIRSSMALLMTGVLASHLFLRRWWSRSVVLLLIVPLAVFKNALRIVTLCLLTLYVDAGFMAGGLHHKGGIVFFSLTLAMLVPIVLGLRKLETK